MVSPLHHTLQAGLLMLCCGLIFVSVSVPLWSADIPLTQSQPQPAGQGWQPPEALRLQYDWLLLDTNEWIAGKVRSLYLSRLQFHSRKFKLREYKWRTVRRLLTARIYTVALKEGEPISGRLDISDHEIRVLDQQGEVIARMPRQAILSIAPGAGSRIRQWESEVLLSASLRSGNSEQYDIAGDSDLRYRSVRVRWTSEYLANYSKVRGKSSVNNHKFSSVYDWLITDRFYITPLAYTFFRDPFSNISQKHTFTTGIGTLLSDEPGRTWEINTGLGYQRTRYSSVEEDDDRRVSTPVLSFGNLFERELTVNLDFESDYRVYLVNDRSGFYIHYWNNGLSLDLTTLLDFETSLQWDRIQKPNDDSDGSRPDKDDFRLLIGISLTY